MPRCRKGADLLNILGRVVVGNGSDELQVAIFRGHLNRVGNGKEEFCIRGVGPSNTPGQIGNFTHGVAGDKWLQIFGVRAGGLRSGLGSRFSRRGSDRRSHTGRKQIRGQRRRADQRQKATTGKSAWRGNSLGWLIGHKVGSPFVKKVHRDYCKIEITVRQTSNKSYPLRKRLIEPLRTAKQTRIHNS